MSSFAIAATTPPETREKKKVGGERLEGPGGKWERRELAWKEKESAGKEEAARAARCKRRFS